MKLNKTELINALEIVKPALSNREIIEQATSFAFLDNKVVTYNDSISLSHPIKDLEITGAVRAEELYEFLKRGNKDEIQFAVSENELKIKCGKAKAGLRFYQEVKLPLHEVDGEKDWRELPEEFTHNLMFVKDSASKDMSQPIITCVHVTENYLEAADGFQILRLYNEGGWPFENYLIRAEIIPEIHKISPTHVAELEGWLHFKNADDTVISCRVFMDSYPETTNHLAVKGQKIIFPNSMPDILERAMVFTKKDHLMDEEMEIKLEAKKLTVRGENDYGWFEEKAPVKYKGDSVVFYITPSLLQNILSRSNKCTLGKEKIRFEGEDWEYIAMLKEVAPK